MEAVVNSISAIALHPLSGSYTERSSEDNVVSRRTMPRFGLPRDLKVPRLPKNAWQSPPLGLASYPNRQAFINAPHRFKSFFYTVTYGSEPSPDILAFPSHPNLSEPQVSGRAFLKALPRNPGAKTPLKPIKNLKSHPQAFNCEELIEKMVRGRGAGRVLPRSP